MKQLAHRIMLAICLLAVLPTIAPAADDWQAEDVQQRVKALVQGSFMTLNCQVPTVQPLVPEFRRSWQPDTDKLIETFFGDRGYVTDSQRVTSPLWGDGMRYWVSATQSSEIYAGTDAADESRKAGTKTTEVVLMSLDIYSQGFVYVNNAPHPPALIVEKVEREGEPLEFTRERKFSNSEGQQLAEGLVAELMGELTVPQGFQSGVQMAVQDYGKKLFQYRVRPEYVTEYIVYDDTSLAERKEAGRQPVSVPVYDIYVNLLIDGDGQLAGMEYFWDSGLQIQGEAKEAIYVGEAIMSARDFMYQYFDEQPPLMTVDAVSFGYVQRRNNTRKLIPAWLFDASYMRTLSTIEEYESAPEMHGHNSVKIPLTFAVDVRTGEPFVL